MELFHFIRPWWFLSVIPVIVLVLYIYKNTKVLNTWSNHCDEHLLKHILVGQPTKTKKIIYPAFFFILWCLAIVAIAGPTWKYKDVPIYQKNNSRVIALDVSNSMDTTDVSPTRLERAKYKILDVLKRINEGQTGLVVFSSEAFVVSPLTSDSNTIKNLVTVLNSNIVPVQGNSIVEALRKSSELIFNSGAEKGQIIVVTDSTPTSKAISEAKELLSKGIQTDVYAIGTSDGGMAKQDTGKFVKDEDGNIQHFGVNLQMLNALALAGGGKLVTLTSDNSDVKQLLTGDSAGSKMRKDKSSYANTFWEDEGVYFIWALALISVIIFRRGLLEKICR